MSYAKAQSKMNAAAREFFAALREFADAGGADVEDLITQVNEYIEELVDDTQPNGETV